jgi:triosephosphate isomerase
MTPARRPLIAGNWKMNGRLADGTALARDVAARTVAGGAELLLCPPATLIQPVADAIAGSSLQLGGQDCHAADAGAHTGDIAATMLKDLGCAYVIVGHSERRADHGESDETVRAKAAAALSAGLTPIVCVGENEAERDAGRAGRVVAAQLGGSLPDGWAPANLVVAYEPVWAIGTGRTGTPAEIAEIHALIRNELAGMAGDAAALRILYGGSVKPDNAQAILALDDVDGALIGGASLKADDFMAIAASCP